MALSVLLKGALGDNDSSDSSCGKSAAFAKSIFGPQDVFETYEVIVVGTTQGRTGKQQGFPDRNVYDPVSNSDVATLCNSRGHARDYRECLGVENRGLRTEKFRYVALKVHVEICNARPFIMVRAH